MPAGKVSKVLLKECIHRECCKKRPKCQIYGVFKFKNTMECPARDFDKDTFGINKAFRLL